jgi:hypothetical protein
MPDAIRQLTRAGIERLRDYLNRLREGGTTVPPRSLLADSETSGSFSPPCSVERQDFPTRLEAARYLAEVFDGIEGLEEDVGLWSWLSLFYFDQVCPPELDGSRSPGRDYRHILESGYRYGHRHLLSGPFLVYRLHKEAAKLLLSTKVHQENLFHHQLASRQAFISNPAIIKAANCLYLDERTGRPKRGAHDPKRGPGTLLRFIDVVRQLDLNYDLYSMSAEALIDLLPSEFDGWRRKKRFWLRRKTPRT